jgi:hypothetical protein
MIRFRPYHLIVHGNGKYRQGDFPFEPADSPEARAYEERVRVQLNYIAHTSVGKALFQSLDIGVPVYVTPYRGGDCNARTGQLTSDMRKGIRVQYSPESWTYQAGGHFPGYRADETLFHELVHASRLTHHGFEGLKHGELHRMEDPEEFLAVLVSMMYRSERGAKKFNVDYTTGKLVSQLELEAFLASRREYLAELSDFMSDVLVKLVTPLQVPFNPFRDLRRLRSIQHLNAVPFPTRLA